jgi:thiosulfate/3-mercaptopyruvate sulfurtransferase
MMTGDSNLISGQELLSRMGDPNLRIVDCRFDLADPGAGRWAYQNGHIPGAVFADLDMDLSAPVTGESGRHPLPATNALAKTFGRLGIDDATQVVVYDANDGALAARAWWLLKWLGHDRVRLLDGGIDHWVASARAVRKGDEQASSRSFVARPCNDRVLTTAELAGDLDGTARLRLIDARDAARFRGEVEPIDPVAGHIPGSLNLPYSVSLNDDGTWKARAALEAIWLAVLGEDRSAPWSAMCGSGVTACHLAISATEAGFEEPRLYVGSWSEWIRDPGRPVGLGEGPNRRPGAADMA